MDKYVLGNGAMIKISLESYPESQLYADNKIMCEVGQGVGLTIIAENDNRVTVVMNKKQAKAIRKALKMQIKALKENKNKSYYQLTKEAADRI